MLRQSALILSAGLIVLAIVLAIASVGAWMELLPVASAVFLGGWVVVIYAVIRLRKWAGVSPRHTAGEASALMSRAFQQVPRRSRILLAIVLTVWFVQTSTFVGHYEGWPTRVNGKSYLKFRGALILATNATADRQTRGLIRQTTLTGLFCASLAFVLIKASEDAKIRWREAENRESGK